MRELLQLLVPLLHHLLNVGLVVTARKRWACGLCAQSRTPGPTLHLYNICTSLIRAAQALAILPAHLHQQLVAHVTATDRRLGHLHRCCHQRSCRRLLLDLFVEPLSALVQRRRICLPVLFATLLRSVTVTEEGKGEKRL